MDYPSVRGGGLTSEGTEALATSNAFQFPPQGLRGSTFGVEFLGPMLRCFKNLELTVSKFSLSLYPHSR